MDWRLEVLGKRNTAAANNATQSQSGVFPGNSAKNAWAQKVAGMADEV